jgi:hypothetical protein
MKIVLEATTGDFSILCDALSAASHRLMKESQSLSDMGHEGEATTLLNRNSKRLEVLRGQIINQWQ